MMTDSPCCTVIVSYNCWEALRLCLQSLPTAHVIVVDNASADGSADMVRREFPAVTWLANDSNRGFAAACNQGIHATSEPFMLLLNPDTWVSEYALQTLSRVMTHNPKIGACGPRILNEDTTPQPSCRHFPTLGRMILAEFGLRAFYYITNPTGGVDQLMGSCLLLRRSALEQVGFLDERFFVYFEEVDLCLRLRQAGWEVRFVPDATIIHTGGASSQHDRRAALGYRYHSLFEFYRKHYPRWQLPVLKLAVQFTSLARLLIGQREYAGVARQVWSL